MEVVAISKSTRVAPRKVRLVADSIRKLSLENALKALSIIKNRGAQPLEKTLKSAIANALANNNLKQDVLKIKSVDVVEAPAYKRYHPSTRGRVHAYKRRGSHIKIVLTDNSQNKISDVKIQEEEKIQNAKKEKGEKVK